MSRMSLASVAVLAALCLSATAFGSNLKAKIALQSVAPGKAANDAPCFIVYPDGEPLQLLLKSGLQEKIDKGLADQGYTIVTNPDDAAVFVKVDFAQLPPFEAEVTVKGRNSWDYSNSAASRNYAAILHGGRYSELADPQRNRDTQNVSNIIGPSGELINPADQKPIEATVQEGAKQSVTMTLHPVAFQISGWRFDTAEADPENLWQVTASLELPQEEALAPQLADLAEVAIKQIGKPLKKTKYITRKTK